MENRERYTLEECTDNELRELISQEHNNKEQIERQKREFAKSLIGIDFTYIEKQNKELEESQKKKENKFVSFLKRIIETFGL